MEEVNSKDMAASAGAEKMVFKFSDIAEALHEKRVVMDMPGVLVLVNQECSLGRVETKGLPENYKLNLVFPMMMGGLTELAKDAMEYKPEALGTIAKWWGRDCQKASVKSVLGGFLSSL